MNPYIIVSGYAQEHPLGQAWFHHLWWDTNIAPLKPRPNRVFIIGNSNVRVPDGRGEWISLSGDLGDCGDRLRGENNFFLPGAPGCWMIGAWLAYANQTDLVYVEQDVLAFGPWLQRMEQEGGKQAVFGAGKLHGGSSTALFRIRHAYIPQWCHDYLAEGPENVPGRLAEQKWKRMAQRRPEDYTQFTFGYDADRPFNPNDSVWYGQQFTRKELLFLEAKGLISCDGMPDDTDLFSNH